jgi:hypothetical protein
MDDEKPDTRHLVLKPKVIDPINSPSRPGDGTAISVRLIHRENLLAEEKRAAGGQSVPRPGENAQATPGDPEAISVPEMLLENRNVEVESGLADLKPKKKRKSRRNRDFFLLVGTLDAVIALMMWWTPDVFTVIYGISGITLVTSMFAWIMYVVNDDY